MTMSVASMAIRLSSITTRVASAPMIGATIAIGAASSRTTVARTPMTVGQSSMTVRATRSYVFSGAIG